MDARHYKIVANALSETKARTERTVWWDLIITFCDGFSAINPRFDREKFIDACEYRKETDESKAT